MPSRNELNARAYAMGFDPATIANDSKLEQKVLWLEKNQTATTITGTAPTTTLTTSGVFSPAETFTIGGVVYTMRAAITAASPANEIKIGAAATNSLDNIKDAINGTSSVGAPGTEYAQATKRHPLVTAGTKTASTLIIAATDTNVGGTVATTETCANAAFTGATLSAGTLGAAVVAGAATKDTLAGIAGDANNL